MASFEIHRATKRRAKLRLGMSGPAGSGKTYSALMIASGLGGRIGMIDTEHGSGDLYADLLPEGYDVLTLSPPYTPARYIEAIHALEDIGVQTIIIDSLTHAWSGEGGSLDRQGKIADKSGNSWQAWRQVTPEHNALVEAILQSRCHIIATMRAKTEYVQEKDERTGKQVVRKVGLAPIMRDGIEYEFTTFFELDVQHQAYVGKDRTRLFDGQIFRPDPETGRNLASWLNAGVDGERAGNAMTPDQKTAMADAINRAESQDDLYRAFAVAYRVANSLHDQDALAELTALKDQRKALLEPHPQQFGMAA
ncbi:ATP-binding protein [Noviherbaspirillum galbum]|uniref:ATP-binding protein n=1 Tax=Noviherbaspirillum galbum TaxID=2709383 RepID=A0A6B3SSP8_9BURK|nr:ATP-binding protein [Noviherbaspirillum galbum]NEX60639.1 ATP-binding protein [Noviherbaspirillum galbum]